MGTRSDKVYGSFENGYGSLEDGEGYISFEKGQITLVVRTERGTVVIVEEKGHCRRG